MDCAAVGERNRRTLSGACRIDLLVRPASEYTDENGSDQKHSDDRCGRQEAGWASPANQLAARGGPLGRPDLSRLRRLESRMEPGQSTCRARVDAWLRSTPPRLHLSQ